MKTNYTCPSCAYYNKQTVVNYKYVCSCTTCFMDLKHVTDPAKERLLLAFANHSKSGFKCPDCERFLPQSLANDKDIICPYPNCLFKGKIDLLKKMRHPIVKTEAVPVAVVKPPQDMSPVLEVIEDQINALQYTSVSCTLKQKTFVYKAFHNLIKKQPEDMTAYLMEGKRGDRLQSKLFQEYISVLENSIPFSLKSGRESILVDSITHPKFNPFDGLSKFEAVVENNGIIKNKTSELYIGNRKSYYCQPFYIGKLLDIVNDEGSSVMYMVKDYSFSVIRTSLESGTKVQVTHLRIPAHYQVGILSHINRIKRSISVSLLENKK